MKIFIWVNEYVPVRTYLFSADKKKHCELCTYLYTKIETNIYYILTNRYFLFRVLRMVKNKY